MFKTIDSQIGANKVKPDKNRVSSVAGGTEAVATSFGPIADATLRVQGKPQGAAITSGAFSGVAAGAGQMRTQGYGSPFGMPLASGPVPGTGLNTLPSPVNPSTVGSATNPTSVIGGTTGSGNLSFEQMQEFYRMMQQSNMQMLVLQADVQNINREFSTFSNILKSKHDTEMNAVRNIRVS